MCRQILTDRGRNPYLAIGSMQAIGYNGVFKALNWQNHSSTYDPIAKHKGKIYILSNPEDPGGDIFGKSRPS